MPSEIERKFLVTNDSWKQESLKTELRQGYLSVDPERTVRVRTIDLGGSDQGYITIKGKTEGVSRLEFEYEIPAQSAHAMLNDLCIKPVIEKTRHKVWHEGNLWEIDVFHGVNDGLVVAEIELKSEDQVFTKPSWLGEEVSSDTRYFNASLMGHPYCEWKKP